MHMPLQSLSLKDLVCNFTISVLARRSSLGRGGMKAFRESATNLILHAKFVQLADYYNSLNNLQHCTKLILQILNSPTVMFSSGNHCTSLPCSFLSCPIYLPIET